MFDLVAAIVMVSALMLFGAALLYFVITDYMETKKET